MPVDFLLVTSSEAICKRAPYIPVVCVLSGGPANDEGSGRETAEFEIMSVMSDNSWAAIVCGSIPVSISSLVNLMVFTLSPERAVVSKSINFSCEMRPTCKQKN